MRFAAAVIRSVTKSRNVTPVITIVSGAEAPPPSLTTRSTT